MSLFEQTLFPSVSARRSFAESDYSGPDLDTTDNFYTPTGVFVSRDPAGSAEELRVPARERLASIAAHAA
jgi:hypothetical protein